MEWVYNGRQITKLPDSVVGFVYTIYYTNGQKYIGKKTAKSLRKKNFGKKKLAQMTDKRMKKHEHILTEHNWRDYEGSTKASEGLEIQTKVITHLCTDKRSMTYLEVEEMVENKVLFNDRYLNDNILGKFYDNSLDGLYQEQVIEQPNLFNI